MIKLKSYKFRIYPNKTQEVLFNKTFGCVRYFWNMQTAIFNSYNRESNPNPIYKSTTEIRNEFTWMKEVSHTAVQQKERDFEAYKKQRFSKNRKKVINNPKFKKRGYNDSFRLSNTTFKLFDNKIQLCKIGKVSIIKDREIPADAKFMSVTIKRTPTNEYYASIVVEQTIDIKNKTGKTVGIDLGIKEFYVSSDNIVVGNPKFFRESQSKLKKAQQHLSRKKKGSNRRKKAKLKVAKIHRTIARKREHFMHNLTTQLVTDYDVIVLEDLDVAELLKNHNLAKSISDAAFYMFRAQLEYKCNWYGKQLKLVNRFEPTSKKCSCCGWINPELTLKDRTFICKECGLILDRDYNAALNIKAVGVNAA